MPISRRYYGGGGSVSSLSRALRSAKRSQASLDDSEMDYKFQYGNITAAQYLKYVNKRKKQAKDDGDASEYLQWDKKESSIHKYVNSEQRQTLRAKMMLQASMLGDDSVGKLQTRMALYEKLYQEVYNDPYMRPGDKAQELMRLQAEFNNAQTSYQKALESDARKGDKAAKKEINGQRTDMINQFNALMQEGRTDTDPATGTETMINALLGRASMEQYYAKLIGGYDDSDNKAADAIQASKNSLAKAQDLMDKLDGKVVTEKVTDPSTGETRDVVYFKANEITDRYGVARPKLNEARGYKYFYDKNDGTMKIMQGNVVTTQQLVNGDVVETKTTIDPGNKVEVLDETFGQSYLTEADPVWTKDGNPIDVVDGKYNNPETGEWEKVDENNPSFVKTMVATNMAGERFIQNPADRPGVFSQYANQTQRQLSVDKALEKAGIDTLRNAGLTTDQLKESKVNAKGKAIGQTLRLNPIPQFDKNGSPLPAEYQYNNSVRDAMEKAGVPLAYKPPTMLAKPGKDVQQGGIFEVMGTNSPYFQNMSDTVNRGGNAGKSGDTNAIPNVDPKKSDAQSYMPGALRGIQGMIGLAQEARPMDWLNSVGRAMNSPVGKMLNPMTYYGGATTLLNNLFLGRASAQKQEDIKRVTGFRMPVGKKATPKKVNVRTPKGFTSTINKTIGWSAPKISHGTASSSYLGYMMPGGNGYWGSYRRSIRDIRRLQKKGLNSWGAQAAYFEKKYGKIPTGSALDKAFHYVHHQL